MYRKSIAILIIFASAAFALFGCGGRWVQEVKNGDTPLADGPAGHAGPGDLTANPAPGRPGAYTMVCTHDYNLAANRSQWGFARVYVPILEEGQCDRLGRGDLVELNRRFNLVIIAHADGQGPIIDAHLNYGPLAEHLASHAFIVVSINRYATQSITGAQGVFRPLLDAHLQHLYNSSPVRFSITDNVALLGHSAGGRAVLTQADTVEDAGRDLRAVVLLAPTVNLNNAIAFNGIADAFLGLHIFRDTDAAAYGSKGQDLPMQSTFLVYDRAGNIPGQPNQFTVDKSFVFTQANSHYFQNELFTLAFINAFLQQHVNKHQIFQRFLKFQERPPSLNSTMRIHQQHQGLSRLTVADFEASSNQTTNTLGGGVFYGQGGFSIASVQNSAVVDPFSPHDSGVLYLETAEDSPRTVTFEIPEPLNVTGFGHLGFRITQVYHPTENAEGEEIDFAVCLSSDCSDGSVAISDAGGLLAFPAVVDAPVMPLNTAEPGVTLLNGQTKNAMRSYLIRLSDFADADLSSIEAITIDFTDVGIDKRLILDDLAFYPW